MSVKIDSEGPSRSKNDPVRLRKLRQTSQAAFAASSFSSWLNEIHVSKLDSNTIVGSADFRHTGLPFLSLFSVLLPRAGCAGCCEHGVRSQVM